MLLPYISKGPSLLFGTFSTKTYPERPSVSWPMSELPRIIGNLGT